MVISLLSVLVFLLILGVIFWAVRALAAALAIPPPIVVVVQVILVIVALIYLLQLLGVGGFPVLRISR